VKKKDRKEQTHGGHNADFMRFGTTKQRLTQPLKASYNNTWFPNIFGVCQ